MADALEAAPPARTRAPSEWPYSAAAVALALGLRALLPPVLCDDAYITLRTAFHAAHGAGLAFNAHEPVYVSTTPLWAVLLAALQRIGLEPIDALTGLGATSEMLLGVAMVRLGTAVFGRPVIGWLAAAVLFANPVFTLTSHSGMELPLYLALIALTLALLANGSTRAAFAVSALSVWVRVDALALCLIALIGALRRPRGRLASLVPGLAILAAYAAFGIVFYGQAFPASAERKLATVAIFKPWWWSGAHRIAVEFIKTAFFGRSAYWYAAASPMPALAVPFAIGLLAAARRPGRGLLATLLFAALYAGAFVLSGATTVENYPWYFTPPLVGVALVAAAGAAKVVESLGARLRLPPAGSGARALAVAPGLLWVLLMLPAQMRDQSGLVAMWSEREQVYAGAAAWLSRVLPGRVAIASNEIGTIGWYARPDVYVLDLYGLALPRPDRVLGRRELVTRHRPEAILLRDCFAPYYGAVLAAPGYRWSRVRTLAVGIRTDLDKSLTPRVTEVPAEIERVRLPGR